MIVLFNRLAENNYTSLGVCHEVMPQVMRSHGPSWSVVHYRGYGGTVFAMSTVLMFHIPFDL